MIFAARNTCSRIYPTSRRPRSRSMAPATSASSTRRSARAAITSRIVVPAATAGRRSAIPNAVHAAASAASMLASLPLPKTPRTTLSVSRIGGGTSINSIPEQGWLEVDLRSTSASVLERFDREVRIIVRAAAQQENARRATATPPLAYDVMVIGDRPSGELSADHPLVLSAIEATQLIDREPELAAASTDANVPIAAGIPAIAIGAGGRGGDAHTAGEWYDNIEGTLGIARAMTILATAAELA